MLLKVPPVAEKILARIREKSNRSVRSISGTVKTVTCKGRSNFYLIVGSAESFASIAFIFCIACPRWLIRFLLSRSISANVRASPSGMKRGS